MRVEKRSCCERSCKTDVAFIIYLAPSLRTSEHRPGFVHALDCLVDLLMGLDLRFFVGDFFPPDFLPVFAFLPLAAGFFIFEF